MQKARMLKLEYIGFKSNEKAIKMIIRTIEEMEKVVSTSKDLSWDGWTVVRRYKSDKARTSKHGVCIKGVWYIQQRFEPSIDGWNIPEQKKHNA